MKTNRKNAVALLAEITDRGFSGRYIYGIKLVTTRWLLSRVKKIVAICPKGISYRRLNEAIVQGQQDMKNRKPSAAHDLLDAIDRASQLCKGGN